MDSVALVLFRFFSRTRQKAGAAVRAPGAAPHPHPHPHECNYVVAEVGLRFVQARLQALEFAPEHQSRSVNLC